MSIWGLAMAMALHINNRVEADIGSGTIERSTHAGNLSGVEALLQERWGEEIERFYKGTAHGKEAIEESKKTIAKLKESMVEANGDEDSVFGLEGRLFPLRKGFGRANHHKSLRISCERS